jgi:hypothetical protein
VVWDKSGQVRLGIRIAGHPAAPRAASTHTPDPFSPATRLVPPSAAPGRHSTGAARTRPGAAQEKAGRAGAGPGAAVPTKSVGRKRGWGALSLRPRDRPHRGARGGAWGKAGGPELGPHPPPFPHPPPHASPRHGGAHTPVWPTRVFLLRTRAGPSLSLQRHAVGVPWPRGWMSRDF